VSLTFARRVTRRTPGRFRTRVLTTESSRRSTSTTSGPRIKQYFKEGRALRTECTINDTRDFGIGRRLPNLPALREIGFPANRRLLEVQRISCDPIAGTDTYHRVCQPVVVDNQRVPALRFDAPPPKRCSPRSSCAACCTPGSPTATCEPCSGSDPSP
jgi:hypothetical protein